MDLATHEMLKNYIFWGCFIAVLIGIVITLVKRRERGRRRQSPPPAATTIAPSGDRRSGATPIAGTPRLMCLGGSHHGHRVEIPLRGLAIGRAGDNDLVIVDGRISPHHAWIGIVDGRVMLRDYQSLGGTFLNGDMDTPVSEIALLNGDKIFFGGRAGDQFQLVIE
jgi:hypothetical protein